MPPIPRSTSPIAMAAPDVPAPAMPILRMRGVLFSTALLVVGACSTAYGPPTDNETGFIKELPEPVALIAAPYQNLNEVVLKPEDGCYWYRHVGPVETTLLPLRTVEGRAICTGVPAKPAVAG